MAEGARLAADGAGSWVKFDASRQAGCAQRCCWVIAVNGDFSDVFAQLHGLIRNRVKLRRAGIGRLTDHDGEGFVGGIAAGIGDRHGDLVGARLGRGAGDGGNAVNGLKLHAIRQTGGRYLIRVRIRRDPNRFNRRIGIDSLICNRIHLRTGCILYGDGQLLFGSIACRIGGGHRHGIGARSSWHTGNLAGGREEPNAIRQASHGQGSLRVIRGDVNRVKRFVFLDGPIGDAF